MLINGNTEIIPHIGYPTHSFKAPMIYNPYFAKAGINAIVVPTGCKAENFPDVFRQLFTLTNIRGALITMPHKISVLGLVDEISPTAQIAGACNGVKRLPDGRLVGDQFDGAGFVRGLLRKGVQLQGARVLVVGSGGVGSAIAASLAGEGIAHISLFDINDSMAQALGQRLQQHYPAITVSTGSNDPAGYDVVVNATPMGMNDGDPLPMDVARLDANTFVGEVVMHKEMTAFLAAAAARGCKVQVGTDMLFEMIPAYLEFFGLPTTTPEELRTLAQIQY